MQNSKKKLILITYDMVNALHYRQELLDFFGDMLEIETHTVCDGIEGELRGDVILKLSPLLNEEILAHCPEEIDIIQGQKVLSREGYRKLAEIVPGTKVLLMTTNKTSAFEMAAYLYQCGITHLDFLPSYPENTDVYDVDVAVTPGQLRFIPPYIAQVVDIGWRRIAPDALMSLMVALHIKNEHYLERLYRYSRTVVNHDFSNTTLDSFSRTRELLYQTCNLIDYGVMILNRERKVLFANDAFLSMLDIRRTSVNMAALLKKLPAELNHVLLDEREQEDLIIRIPDRSQVFSCSRHIFMTYKEKAGEIVILKDAHKIEKLEGQIRRSTAPQTYTAKYTFRDIVGKSPAIVKCISHAGKIARTELPVLITGESGTGKELFAQSIHNASDRYDKPFVALNCAALSKELLESELFGYEDGAFTGAKRGGKKGLFEFAHKGTIFLDEIGDMPMELQAKLLRVLQEKEIRRIGGNLTIPVDVRIITATNLDLKELVSEKRFRLDLFYRISMFTLLLPPLRNRGKDILLLADHFLRPFGKSLSEPLSELLLREEWRGNIRELQNCMQYMAIMGEGILTVDDLPPGYGTEGTIRRRTAGALGKTGTEGLFEDMLYKQRELCSRILQLLLVEPMGRMRLLQKLQYAYTEHEIKKAMGYLDQRGLIRISRGRGGTSLSEKGMGLAKEFMTA